MADGTTPNPRFARAFAGAVGTMDRRGAAEHRRRLVSTAHGTVVEVGSGTGANFAHYPGAVDRVIAVEPEPELRELSAGAARRAPVPVTVLDGVAEALPVADAGADTVVVSLVLCSVTDQRAAIRECRRILRPDGLLLFYEHVRSSHRLVALAEDLVTPLWSRLTGGCHPNRDTVAMLEAGGFEIVQVDRFGFAPLPLNPSLAHVLGSARPSVRPEDRRR
ncbi:class I SAM-dependent methyltransferase [Lysobacter korlensis]|uniref:Class I SAM-dependent methyltransferase n=1 Tax=Lysobacter korlensis TaxID=553636 RepID=A0ABV6RPU5_9GAMM